MIGITKLRIVTTLIVIMCLSVSACKTSSDSDPLIKQIPADGTSVALIKDPNQTIINTMRWLERALGPTGRSISDRLRREGQRLLGFDPVNSSLSKKLYLDNDVGVAFFSMGTEEETLFLARSTKPDKLEETVLNWYRRIDSSAKMMREKTENPQILLYHFGKPFGQELVKSFSIRKLDDGWFIAGSSASALRDFRSPKLSESLAADAQFSKVTKDTSHDIHVWAPPAALFGNTDTQLNRQTQGVVSSLKIGAKGLTFSSEAPLALPSFLNAMKSEPMGALLAKAHEDDFFVASTRLARPSTVEALAIHPPWQAEILEILKKATGETGLNIQKEVLPQLNGDVLVSVGLHSDANVANLKALTRLQSLSLLGSQFRGRIYLGLKDPKTMQSHLDKGLATLQSQGQPLRQRISPEGYKIIEPATAEPAFGWAIVNDYYVYALGPNQLQEAMTDLHTKKTHSNGLASAFGTKRNASTAILRLGVMSQSLEALVQDAGLAPQLRGFVKPALEALKRIGDLALSLEFTETSVRLTLSERLP